LFRLLHKTCFAGILPQKKTDIVFSAPFIGNDDRGVFFMCVRVHTKTSNFFHDVFTLSS